MKSRHEPKKKKKKGNRNPYSTIFLAAVFHRPPRLFRLGVRRRIRRESWSMEFDAHGEKEGLIRGALISIYYRTIHRGKKLKFIEANALLTTERGYIPFRSPLFSLSLLATQRCIAPLPTFVPLLRTRLFSLLFFSSFFFNLPYPESLDNIIAPVPFTNQRRN